MKRFLYVLLSFAAVSFAVGCSEDDAITPAPEDPIENPLVYEVDQVVFGSQKSEKVVTLQNIESDNFMITKPAADKWVSFKKGEGNTIVVSVKANATDIRESKITAISGQIVEEIPIWQDAPRSIKFPQIPDLRGTGGSTTFGFTANIAAPFEVKVADADQSWLDVTVDQDNKTVTATVGQNIPKAGDRTGTFTISGYSEFGDYIETEVPVTQVGIDRPNYKFSLPDFSQSKVYKVMLEGQQIAEICLEWLGSENAADGVSVDAQAVVVYPMASNGKADLSNGYVAKIVKANTGVNAYTYAAPTTAVHGGKVVWDTANNCISAYTAGTEAEPVETLVIPADNLVFGTETFADLTELTSIEPDVVVDNRPNDTPRTYTVVKVGTQYWMGEYLKARCFVDGTKIGNAEVKSGGEWTKALRPLCCVANLNEATGYWDVWNAETADAMEAAIQLSGVLYNYNCINNITLPEDTAAFTTWWQANYAEKDDLPVEGDVLAPAGWMVPSLTQVAKLETYIADNNSYAGLEGVADKNPKYRTFCRRICDYSKNLPQSCVLPWAMDENITGLGITVTPRIQNGSAFRKGTNSATAWDWRTSTHCLTRTFRKTVSSGTTSGFYLITTQNGGLDNSYFYDMRFGMVVRCIRK
ncbi:MAG: hypothetical protein E7148_07270 [Rikenellaceae bacterium]|nr:hypothetical protein [Rikenellaceae bacterium]